MQISKWFCGFTMGVMLCVSGSILAGETTSVPKDERGFVDMIGKLNKSQIIALLGEPAKAEDIKLKDSGRVVASIWHYHNINVDAKGQPYPTTELDFVEDNVNVIVFLNNDGSDASEGGTYEIKTNPSSI